MGRPVVQWQILSGNPDRVAAFYTALFGWSVDQNNPMGYRQVDTEAGRGISGGIWPAPPGVNPFVQLFIEVEDMAATVESAVKLGGKVLFPPQRLPEGEEMAVIQDPEGMTFGLVKPA